MTQNISLDTEVMERIANRLVALASRMDDVGGRLAGMNLPEEAGGKLRMPVRVRLQTTGQSFGGSGGDLNATLRSIASGLKSLSNYTDQAADKIQIAADDLTDLERSLARIFSADNIPAKWKARIFQMLGGGASNDIAGGTVLASFLYTYENLGLLFRKESVSLMMGEMLSITYEEKQMPLRRSTTYKAELFDRVKVDLEENRGLNYELLKYKHEVKERPDLGDHKKSKNQPETKYEGDMELLRFGADKGASISYSLAKDSDTQDNYKWEYAVDASAAEIHGEAYAGMYSYRVTADGSSKRVFAPGAAVDLGASYSLLDASASGEYELIDNVSLVGDVSLQAGMVSAGAKGKIGYVDKQWVASAEASAEAIAGRLSGDVGVDIAGIKGTIGGSVDFGIGAHAKVGFSDGKLYYDVGASCGVGASVNGSLDVGGLAENIYKGARALGQGTCQAVKGFISLIS